MEQSTVVVGYQYHICKLYCMDGIHLDLSNTVIWGAIQIIFFFSIKCYLIMCG